MKLAYIFRTDYENPGDLYSSPMHYLGEPYKGIAIDAFANNVPEMEVDAIIIGGGALMTNEKFVNALTNITEKIHAKHKIVWGVGFESDNVAVDIKNNFDLFSTREYKLNSEIDWVPCASVLHPQFGKIKSVIPTKDFLVVDHFKRSIKFDRPHTRIINRPNCIGNILEKIADHRHIITSSYHVAYWSILAGKQCYVIGENLPTKFRRMKHFPVIANQWDNSLIDQSRQWDDALYESTLANYRFHRQLEDLLNIENPAQLAWHQNFKRETL